tara:strand:- start:1291 stop:2163 length:873 start_codon:yes stop_codon:yes gene_type:complete
MPILAYPTPTFDAKTIRQSPGYRPVGKSGNTIPTIQPNEPTAPSCVNKRAYNSRGFTGNRADKFIQDNQFLPVKRAPGVNPLSKPGTEGLGNLGDSVPQPRPTFDTPKNGDFQRILAIMNSRNNDITTGNLSAGEVRLLAERADRMTAKHEVGHDSGKSVISDFADTQRAMARERRIRNAEAQGFTRQEAVKAYDELRESEAKKALFVQQDVSTRLADLIDSKLGGASQNGKYRNTDESALYLASQAGARMGRDFKATTTLEGIKEAGYKGRIPGAKNRPKEDVLAKLKL